MRVCLAAILLASACAAAAAQQTTCTVPVSVLIPDWSSLSKARAEAKLAEWKRHVGMMKIDLPRWDPDRDWQSFTMTASDGYAEWAVADELPTDAFVVHDKDHATGVGSATIDRGPRRIIFIVENAKKMPPAARRVEAAVMEHILSKARPEDSFALLTARGPRREVRFGADREAVRKAAEELGNPPQSKSTGEGVLDAVLEATTWFQPPQPGDSIFLMTRHLERKHKASFSKVRAAVAAGGIRVFGFQLGEFEVHDAGGTTITGLPDRSWEMEAFGGAAALNQTMVLSLGSGGVAVLENTEGGKRYELTDSRIKQLKNNAEQMYKAVTEYYVLELQSTGKHLAIGLRPAVHGQVPVALVLYPEFLPLCSSTTTATPAKARTTK